MALIDLLETRSDTIKLVEGSRQITAAFYNDAWSLMLDGASYKLTDTALEALLGFLRIPVKYIYRCVEDDGTFLAEASVNYWLEKSSPISFLVDSTDEPTITQVLAGKCLYLPAVKVNDLIIEYLGGDVKVESFVIEDDIFNAVYVTNESVQVLDRTYKVGVRVLFSDCFSIPPRFDGILFHKETGTILGWPTLGRKFRVASSTIPQVIEQIEEYLGLSLDGVRYTLAPALPNATKQESSDAFLTSLCNVMRLSRKVRDELMENAITEPTHTTLDIAERIAAYSANPKEGSIIDFATARDIQIALSLYIVFGSFK